MKVFWLWLWPIFLIVAFVALAATTFTHTKWHRNQAAVMPGQRLPSNYGQTVRFVAEGEWLLLYSPFERGDKLKGWRLVRVGT